MFKKFIMNNLTTKFIFIWRLELKCRGNISDLAPPPPKVPGFGSADEPPKLNEF